MGQDEEKGSDPQFDSRYRFERGTGLGRGSCKKLICLLRATVSLSCSCDLLTYALGVRKWKEVVNHLEDQPKILLVCDWRMMATTFESSLPIKACSDPLFVAAG